MHQNVDFDASSFNKTAYCDTMPFTNSLVKQIAYSQIFKPNQKQC